METDWQTLAAIHILVGFESGLLGFLPFAGFFLTGVQFRRGSNDEWKATEGLLIAGFLCYAVVAVIVSLQKFAKLKAAEKVISIINIVLLVLAAICLIAGVAIAGKSGNPYTSMLEATGALLAFISAVFLIISLATGGFARTAPSSA